MLLQHFASSTQEVELQQIIETVYVNVPNLSNFKYMLNIALRLPTFNLAPSFVVPPVRPDVEMKKLPIFAKVAH